MPVRWQYFFIWIDRCLMRFLIRVYFLRFERMFCAVDRWSVWSRGCCGNMVRGGLNIVFVCHAFHFTQRVASIPTSCLDISAYWCVCVFRIVEPCFVIAMFAFCFDVMSSASVLVLLFVHSSSRVLLLCWRLDRLVFLISVFILRGRGLKNAVFILRTGKKDSSAETTILCHVCD